MALTVIRTGKNWKLQKNKALGNYRVTYKGKDYTHSTKALAEVQVKAIIAVNRKLAARARK